MNKARIQHFLMFLLLVTLSYSKLCGHTEVGTGDGEGFVFDHSMIRIDGITVQSDPSRAMYVDDFDNILGVDSLENVLLSYAQSHEVGTLLLNTCT